ncbi:MAG TPA: VCBS repeat-containing protein [Blastocatellia bacterium]|nr:VCBS repeat-containing protein [Blastocatellia bacterium]
MKPKLLLLQIAFVAIGWALLGYAQPPLFIAAPPAAVGDGSGHLVLADVNRDGKLDLIAQHLMQQVVTVQLGDGTGRFAMASGSPLKLDYRPVEAKVGDINGDGMPDLAVARGDRDAVDIFFGDGTGKFKLAPSSPFHVSTAEYNTGLQLLDINGDGKLDLLTTHNQRNSFATLLGDGRGGVAKGATTTFPAGQGRYSFAFGDLDGDKHLDVAITNTGNGNFIDPGRVIVLRGDGQGAFKLWSETSLATGARYVTMGDLNNDQRMDLAFTHSGGTISTLLNQGQGKFTTGTGYDLQSDLFGVAIADANGDQKNDLVVATVNSVTVLLNELTQFTLAPGAPYKAGPGAYHLAIGDVNRDGKMDIAASSFEGKVVTVLLRR